jgi:protein lifeguard
LQLQHIYLINAFFVIIGAVMIPMIFCRKKHPINLVLLGLFTVCISLTVGLGCLSRNGD